MQRKLTLIEIGAGPLPVVTPVVPRQSSWFPVVYVSPDTPSVDGVVPMPVADGVLIEWAAVDQEAVIYIIERGPSENGPWTEIHRTTETRYFYSDGSGQQWWFKITASVRGKAGEGTVVGVTPGRVPSYEEMEELNRKLGQEVIDRLAGDLKSANDAIAAARQYTDEEVTRLNSLLAEFMDAPAWEWETEYPVGFYVKSGAKLYAARQAPNINLTPHDHPQQWTLIGEFASVADAFAASISMSTQNASDIAAEALRTDAVVARMPAGGGKLATSAQVASEQQARVDADTALGQRVDLTNAALGDKASTARVTAVEQASVDRDSALGQRIDQTDAALDGKASAGAVDLIESKVEQLEDKVDASAAAITQVRAQANGSNNLLINTQWWAGLGTVRQRQNPGGQNVSVLLNVTPTYTLRNENTLAVFESGRGGGTTFPFSEWQIGEDVEVVQDQRIEVSVYGVAHRCRFQLKLVIQNYLGQDLAIFASDWIDPTGLAGSELWNYQRVGVFGVVPSGGVRALCVLVKENTAAGSSNSYLFAVRPYLGRATPTQIQLSNWTAGATDKGFAAATQTLSVRATQLENGQSVLMAQYNVVLDVNGRIVGQRAVNDGRVGSWDFVADVFSITDPNNTGSTTFEQGRWITRSGGFMLAHGKPFGTTGDLMMWLGIGSNPANASKGNGLFWIDNKGNGYFGGALSAGVLRNAVQTTSIQTMGTELVNGPFTTNGNTRQVSIGFSRTVAATKNALGSSGFVAGAGANTATVQVYRQIGNAAETLWQTLNVTGGITIMNEPDAADQLYSQWGGSVTVNDSSTPQSTVRYRAVVTAFAAQGFSHTSGSYDAQTVSQNLSIVSVEN